MLTWDQYVASNGMYNAGVIASPRAAEIYGLNVLAENIQVKSLTSHRHLQYVQLTCFFLPFLLLSTNMHLFTNLCIYDFHTWW